MIRISQAENITITGGNLIGDRLTHYVEAGGGALINIAGGKNITVDGVNMSLANSAGLTIFSYSNIRSNDYFGSQYVTVKNCVFDFNRTNNLALTDGQDITFENNFSYRAGNDLDADFGTSEGLAPRVGIILETQLNQYIENVIVKGNIVEDTQSIEQHSILTVGATHIEITGNTTDKNVGWSTALGVEVKGNICGGIFGGFLGFEGVDNIISGNTVTNKEGTGIYLTDQNVKVFDNDIINCSTAIQLTSIINVEIYKNNIESDVESSIGILGQNYLDNVIVTNNNFKLTAGKPLNILYVNAEEEHENYQFSFTGNTSENYIKTVVSGSHNIDIIDNTFTGAGINIDKESNTIKVEGNTVIANINNSTFSISNSTDIEIITNTFNTTSSGILSIGAIFNNSTDIVFKGNTVNALGINYGMYVADTNEAILMYGNTLQNASTFRAPLHFLGSNSEIINNIFINSNNKDAYYEGDNNITSENMLNP